MCGGPLVVRVLTIARICMDNAVEVVDALSHSMIVHDLTSVKYYVIT